MNGKILSLDSDLSVNLIPSSLVTSKGGGGASGSTKKVKLASTKQSNFSSSRSSISTTSSTQTANDIDFQQFCPEFALLDWKAPLPTPLSQMFSPPSESLAPSRDVYTVSPTTLAISGAPYIFSRPPDNYRTSEGLGLLGEVGASLNSSPYIKEPSMAKPDSSPFENSVNITSTAGPNPREPEFLIRKSNSSFKKVMHEQTAQILRPSLSTSILVYDVMDESVRRGVCVQNLKCLDFESRFESGNLQLAIQVSPLEYDLILQSDIGSQPGRHNQWFYFSISNMRSSEIYKLNIINMSKGSSQFGEGMQPVVFSVKDNLWRRLGDNVYFYKNHFSKPSLEKSVSAASKSNGASQKDGSLSSQTYSTLTFSLAGQTDDTYFIAYHYPYTYSDLGRLLDSLQFGLSGNMTTTTTTTTIDAKLRLNSSLFDEKCRRQTLCKSEGGNEVELLTITAFDEESIVSFPLTDRVYVFLTSRVHPGESNSSHIMQGVIKFLMGDDQIAVRLRTHFVFKIVPMLNPDGVINGSHRCGLAGTDLNRQWRTPSQSKSASIYWTKSLWRYLVDTGHRPLISCDFHGHSKKKSIFIFGCENGPGPNEGFEKIFPSLMASACPVFDSNLCKYTTERSKEATARVVLWREMGIVGSYTLESSYCGTDLGDKKGIQFQITDLERVGAGFCNALWTAYGVFGGIVPVAQPAPLPRSKDKDRDQDQDRTSSDDDDDIQYYGA